MVTENKSKLNEAEREKLDERKTFTSEKITKKKNRFRALPKKNRCKRTRTNNNYISLHN